MFGGFADQLGYKLVAPLWKVGVEPDVSRTTALTTKAQRPKKKYITQPGLEVQMVDYPSSHYGLPVSCPRLVLVDDKNIRLVLVDDKKIFTDGAARAFQASKWFPFDKVVLRAPHAGNKVRGKNMKERYLV